MGLKVNMISYISNEVLLFEHFLQFLVKIGNLKSIQSSNFQNFEVSITQFHENDKYPQSLFPLKN